MSKTQKELEALFKKPAKNALSSIKAKINQIIDSNDVKVLLNYTAELKPMLYLMPSETKKDSLTPSKASWFDDAFFGRSVNSKEAKLALASGKDIYRENYTKCQAYSLIRKDGDKVLFVPVTDINFNDMELACQMTISEDGISAIVPGLNDNQPIEVRRGASSFGTKRTQIASSAINTAKKQATASSTEIKTEDIPF